MNPPPTEYEDPPHEHYNLNLMDTIKSFYLWSAWVVSVGHIIYIRVKLNKPFDIFIFKFNKVSDVVYASDLEKALLSLSLTRHLDGTAYGFSDDCSRKQTNKQTNKSVDGAFSYFTLY